MVELLTPRLDGTFHALADATRRRILRELAGRERSVTELAQPFEMSLAAVSKHIKVLEQAGLVSRTIQGRTHVCRLAPRRLAEASAWLSYYEKFWKSRLDALEALLEEQDTDAKP